MTFTVAMTTAMTASTAMSVGMSTTIAMTRSTAGSHASASVCQSSSKGGMHVARVAAAARVCVDLRDVAHCARVGEHPARLCGGDVNAG